MYWVKETRYPLITDAMYLNRYEKLIEFLHANDNTKNNDEGNKGDKLCKIQSVIPKVREKNFSSSRPRAGRFYRRANYSSENLLIVVLDSITERDF